MTNAQNAGTGTSAGRSRPKLPSIREKLSSDPNSSPHMNFGYAIVTSNQGERCWFHFPTHEWRLKLSLASLTLNIDQAKREFQCLQADHPNRKMAMWKFRIGKSAVSDDPIKDF